MFGHGASNYFRFPVCPACAGNYDLSVCTLGKFRNEGAVIYKCYNCVTKNYKNVNHEADDIRCPCKQDYLDVRKIITSNSARKWAKRRNVPIDFNLQQEHFPQLTSTSTSYGQSAVHQKVDSCFARVMAELEISVRKNNADII